MNSKESQNMKMVRYEQQQKIEIYIDKVAQTHKQKLYICCRFQCAAVG